MVKVSVVFELFRNGFMISDYDNRLWVRRLFV